MTKPRTQQATLFAESEENPKVGAPVGGRKPAPKAAPKPKPSPATSKIVAAKKPGTAVARPAPQGNVVALAQTPANMLAVIAKAAADPNVIPEKMRALLEMQKEIVAEEARIEFTRAFIALQDELPYINPDGRIEILAKDRGTGERTGRVQQSTPYATFQNIHRSVMPLLKKYGFTLSFATEPSPDGTRIIVKTILDHVRGHQRTTAFPLPAEVSGSKNNVQGWGSSFSYGKRYGTIALLNIVSDAKPDRDLDGAHPADAREVLIEKPKIDADQIETLTDQIKGAGVGEKRFLTKYGIEKIADLPAATYDDAILACQNFAKNKTGAANG